MIWICRVKEVNDEQIIELLAFIVCIICSNKFILTYTNIPVCLFDFSWHSRYFGYY